MTPTDKFWAYFEPILEAQQSQHDVVKIQLSDADRMDRFVADSRSEDVYPGIFVMRPFYSGQLVDNALIYANFKVKFYVFLRGDLADYASQDTAYAGAEAIVQDIVKQVHHDARAWQVSFDMNSFKAEPVAYFVLDAAWGYEVELKIGIVVNELLC